MSDAPPDTVKQTGVELIAAERRRQVEKEGYDSAHDDGHEHGEIAMAAVCYAAHAAGYPIKAHVPTLIRGDENCGCREADCPQLSELFPAKGEKP